MTSGSLLDYYRDEVNDASNENNDAGNYRINNNRQQQGSLLNVKQK